MSESCSTRLTKKVFQDAESSFAIFKSCDGFSVKGSVMHDPDSLIDILIRFDGNFTNGKYGKEFAFVNYEILENEVYFFLTKIAKGIPTQVACKIAEHYKDGGFEEDLENRPEFFLSFKGIGKKKLNKLKEAWKSSRATALIAKRLAPYGVTANMIVRVYNDFGESAVNIIDENPYRLSEIRGIGFKKSDEIARKIGMLPNDPKRVEACIIYLLKDKISGEGHTYTPTNVLYSMLIEETTIEGNNEPIGYEVWQNAIDMLIEKKAIMLFKDNLVSLYSHYVKENDILDILHMSKIYKTAPLHENIDEIIHCYETNNAIVLGEAQKDAVRLTNSGVKCFCISGYAGTGKTSSAKASLELFILSGVKHEDIACCAFSGVAAARIKKQSGFFSSTIHSLLGYDPAKGSFHFDKNEKLPHSVILLDESSMVDIPIFHALIQAIDFLRTTLIMLGDPAQLPPVGVGEVFSDILKFKLVPNITLDKIYRQSDDAVITQFAQSVRNGQTPNVNGEYSDFVFKDFTIPNYWSLKKTLSKREMQDANAKNQEEILAYILELAKQCSDTIKELHKKNTWAALTYFQVIVPMKNGILGTENLNAMLRPYLNPFADKEPYLSFVNSRIFGKGDKVIHLQNKVMRSVSLSDFLTAIKDGKRDDMVFNDRRVYNGQIGVMVESFVDDDEYYIYYPNESYVIQYSKSDFSNGIVNSANALTIHKSQGSEFYITVLPIVNTHYIMLNNKLLYTAMTRAKQHLTVIGEYFAFKTACTKSDETARRTITKIRYS